MNKKIALIYGDGIGPDIVKAAVKVLERIAEKYHHKFTFCDAPMGGNAIDEYGDPLPKKSVDVCLASDSVLLGAVGGKKWDNLSGSKRPEAGLLGIRKALKLYANIRPAKLFPQVADRSPLRKDIVENGFDMVIVRELTGGIYFGERGIRQGKLGREAYDTECYSEIEIERIARVAFEIAQKRNKKITSIDKANVLESSRLWRYAIHEVAQDYPDVTVNDMFVDNAAMQLVKDPSQFDVIVTSNMFGDILSDLASALTGSIGLLPSASLNDTTLGLYEPIHGSAPDLGENVANPIATILSAAMMLRYSFDMTEEAADVEKAVDKVLCDNRTQDLWSEGKRLCSTSEITDLIIKNI